MSPNPAILTWPRPVAGVGGVVITDLGVFESSGATVAAPSGGSVILLFSRGIGTQSTLESLSHGTVAVARATNRRAGAAVYYLSSPGPFTLTYSGDYMYRAIHIDKALTVVGTWSDSPAAADGEWVSSLSAPASVGELVVVTGGVTSAGDSSTLDPPLTDVVVGYSSVYGRYFSGYGIADTPGFHPSGDIDPAQTNPTYTAVAAAAFSLT